MQCSVVTNGEQCPELGLVEVSLGDCYMMMCAQHAHRAGLREPPPPLLTGSTSARSRCAAWNRTYKVGTRVRFWIGARGTTRPPRASGELPTADEARVIAGVPMVRITNGAVIPLDHVEALP